MLKIGFTGTREIPSFKQVIALCKLFRHLRERWIHGCAIRYVTSDDGEIELHHGDCMRSDEMAHELGLDLGFRVTIHPPEKNTYRAFCKGAHEVRPVEPYLVRNKHIVNACHYLVAVPHMSVETLRSGTWSTVRYARDLRRPIYIVNPDGSVTTERVRGYETHLPGREDTDPPT